MRGYKVFKPDWTCRRKKYTCPGEFEEDVTPVERESGMHFCEKLADCFSYYDFDPDNHVCEVEAYGEVAKGSDKCCTNKLRILREIPWDEVLRIVNSGKNCTGLCNTGDCNTGDWNTGDWNTGDWNTGDWNTGNRNTGDCNTGDWNTGDWNFTSFSAGCFCTEESRILMFDAPSDMTYRDWINSDARHLLNTIPKNVVEWIYSDNMTDEEKQQHPEHETTGGYLKILDESECAQIWWDGLQERLKRIILGIPNFTAEKFEKCTGIKIGGSDE